MKFTTGTLIEFLKQFPEDTSIPTEISFMWNYPKELNSDGLTENEFRELTIENALDLCIFEGAWEKGTVSEDFKKYFKE